MIKTLNIKKLKNQIEEICNRKGYTISGEIKKCNIGESNWTFAIKTANKCFLVKLIVPYGSHNTSICINSKEYISTAATLFGMRGMFGSIDIPIFKEFHFKLPDEAFGHNADECEKIFLIYPKCTQFYLREKDKKILSGFRVGLKLEDISIHDGSSFKHLLEHPDETRKFSRFGE